MSAESEVFRDVFTVAKLIETLQTLPPDAMVLSATCDGAEPVVGTDVGVYDVVYADLLIEGEYEEPTALPPAVLLYPREW